MGKVRTLMKSYTDPNLYQSLIKKMDKNAIHFKIPENRIPKYCQKDLILDYLAEIETIRKDLTFYLLENKVEVHYYCLLAKPCEKNPIALVEKYIQYGELLTYTNKMRLLMQAALLASIAVASLITILLLIFIPTLAASIPHIIIPLSIIAVCFSTILFCSVSLPEYFLIAVAKRGLRECEEKLNNICNSRQSYFRSFRRIFSSQDTLSQSQTESLSLSACDPMEIPPSTSSAYKAGKFFLASPESDKGLRVLADEPTNDPFEPSASCLSE
ncbi:MAG: hypothetical protein V4700_01840 [Pseudomonadota bacterium]